MEEDIVKCFRGISSMSCMWCEWNGEYGESFFLFLRNNLIFIWAWQLDSKPPYFFTLSCFVRHTLFQATLLTPMIKVVSFPKKCPKDLLNLFNHSFREYKEWGTKRLDWIHQFQFACIGQNFGCQTSISGNNLLHRGLTVPTS